MKTFYALLLAVTLGMTMTGQAYAAQNGGQGGQQNGYSGEGYSGNGVGDMIQQRDRDQDCDSTCDGDQLQQRDRDHQQLQDRDQDCDYAGTGDCDGDQLQQRDRVHTQDPQYTRTQYTAEDLNRMQRLLEQLRGAFGRLYGWN